MEMDGTRSARSPPDVSYLSKILVELQKGDQSPWYHYLNSLPRYYTNAASMTPFCCLCLPSLMRKLAVRERGNMSRLSVSSMKLIPYLNDDVKYDVELCNWVYQVVYTRAVEGPDGDWKLVPMADVSRIGAERRFGTERSEAKRRYDGSSERQSERSDDCLIETKQRDDKNRSGATIGLLD